MEKTYNKEAARYIIKGYIKDWVEFRDDGLYIKDDCIDHDWTMQGVFQWSPACELPEHDALTAPVLPVPFSANQLAAFFLTGCGAFVASYYGSFDDGPDEGMLQAMGVRANQPREALRAAFAAYRAARKVVGPLDETLHARAEELGHQYEVADIEANKRENLMEPGISEEEHRERRERARASVAQLHDEADDLKRRANEEHVAWRRRMVHRLLDIDMDRTAGTQGKAPAVGVSGGDAAPLPDPARRLTRLRELGGMATYRRNEWKFTGITALVAAEKREGRKRSDEKTIRADLKEAGEAERDARRAGPFAGLGA